jgi:membrane-bound ClpP family serine protease
MSALVWPLSLLAVGLLLVLAEAFVPSGGALLVLAVVCLGLSVWAAFRQSINLGLTFLLADAVLTPLTIALGLYLWQRSPLAARMTLKAPTSEEIAVLNTGRRVDHLVGERGHTLTPLRPSGTVEFEGRRLEGISEEGLIPEGSSVEARGAARCSVPPRRRRTYRNGPSRSRRRGRPRFPRTVPNDQAPPATVLNEVLNDAHLAGPG